MKILVIDHQAVVREGLRQILSKALGSVELREAEGPEEARDLIRGANWNLAILDVSFPSRSALTFLKEAREARFKVPVLAFGTQPEEQNARWMLKAGAAGYVTKDSPVEEIVRAVKKTVAGGRYISPALAESLALSLGRDSEKPPHETLSQREFQVLRLIALGKTVTLIADDLGLSARTISTYRTRILDKMGMSTNAELIRYALRNGLVE